ncbi:MAG TPA: amidohydrolase family protein [Pirellulales bacterium]|nr:amidohydrolase family protein [Pirellulales bacterium]
MPLCIVVSLVVYAVGQPRTAPVIGLRQNTPRVHAFVGARIVTAPGKTIDRGTIVVRDGVITAVGADAEIPADATVWHLEGKTIYPGFIDALTELPSDGSSAPRVAAGYWNSEVVPQFSAAETYRLDASANEKFRSQGITARVVAPASRIIKGSSALVTTGDDPPQQSILRDEVALHLKLTTQRRMGGDYPNSPMGALALVRQACYDARWYVDAWEAYDKHSSMPRPEQNVALEILVKYLNGKRPVVIDSSDTLYFFRADRLGREFGLNVIVRGSGEEYQRLDAVADAKRPIIVPVNFPKAPNVKNPEAALSIALDKLMHWDVAPENAGRLDERGVKIALSSIGLKDTSAFLAGVRQAVRHGLKPDAALRALTTTPAELAGIAERLGTLQPGKLGHLVVADGDLFDKKTKIIETWIDGRWYRVSPVPNVDVRGTWELQIKHRDGGSESVRLELTGEPTKLAGTIHRGEKQAKLANAQLEASQLTVSFPGKALDWSGVVQLSATVAGEPGLQTPTTQAGEAGSPSLDGTVLWSDGSSSLVTGRRTAPPKPDEKRADKAKKEGDDDRDEATEKKPAEGSEPSKPRDPQNPEAVADKPEDQRPENEPPGGAGPDDAATKKSLESKRPTRALYPVNYPLGEFGVDKLPEQQTVLFRGATVWTCADDGILEHADVLIENGKIKAVGRKLDAPEKATIVDARGKHITPGIIDCHSHIATDGGVNEASHSITAEVRIGDFIDPYDINIYRQLAGGVTAANILHGSANTIGGQNQVIRFRWGALPEDVKFAEAPPGIKFALGENVKQSNWPGVSHTRYPQSRMGVEELMRDAFRAAREYRDDWNAWKKLNAKQRAGRLPPRRDLQLDALVEVIENQRLIHCHSYRQDEILATMRVCEEFGIRIGTFQHILEGYKVADAMARHGVGGSSFSDWWAYKFEVYDAIPYNGAMLHKAGVVVSFNSDDAELARRLNLEAGKAMKYGGVPSAEALKFVTLNPARQLGIDKHTGSLEPGKDADIVVWSGPPMSTLSRCEQTWVDGRRCFDRSDDAGQRKQVIERRAALVQRILESGEPTAGPDDDKKDQWPRDDLFCHDHDDEHDHGARQ